MYIRGGAKVPAKRRGQHNVNARKKKNTTFFIKMGEKLKRNHRFGPTLTDNVDFIDMYYL